MYQYNAPTSVPQAIMRENGGGKTDRRGLYGNTGCGEGGRCRVRALRPQCDERNGYWDRRDLMKNILKMRQKGLTFG